MFCTFQKHSSTFCGPNPGAINEGSRIISLDTCNKDITAHCRTFKIGDDVENEVQLILARVGIFSRSSFSHETICPIHRHQLGIGWRRTSKKCVVPTAIAGHKTRGEIELGINKRKSEYIWKATGIVVAVGSGMCTACRKKLNDDEAVSILAESLGNINLEENTTQVSTPSASCSLVHLDDTPCTEKATQVDTSSESVSDPSYVESNNSVSLSDNGNGEEIDDQKQNFNQKKKLLNDFLIYSGSAQVGVMQKRWDDSKERTKREHLRQAKSAVSSVLRVIAPQDEDSIYLWKMLCKGSLDSDENISPKERELLEALAECYMNATHWSTRRQILSIMADKIPFKGLQQFIPNLTVYRYNIARHHTLLHGRGVTVPKVNYTRMKIDQSQLDHFLNFIVSAHLIQDMPFGERMIKLTTGEIIAIPNVIRNMIPSRIVHQYLSLCEESSFAPLGESTLYMILNACSASIRKTLQGLDNFTAEGGRGYDDLEQAVSLLVKQGMTNDWGRTQKDSLRTSKRYMKGEYKAHVSESSTVPDHCRKWALSDPSDEDFAEDCNHDHDDRCPNCDLLDEIIYNLKSASQECDMTDEEREELVYTIDNAYNQIILWKCHQLRCVNQDEQRQAILDLLNDKTVFVTQDWAMKFLPRKFRESQADWFGKRGLSWHISVVLRKCGEEFETLTFVHLFQSTAQDSNTVIAIMHDVITKLKESIPELEQIFFRQDNAGCYHCANTLLAVKDMSDKTGVNISGVDFSDPQGGKGACDRKAASLKRRISIYANEGHDIEDAKQMKAALESVHTYNNVSVVLSSGNTKPTSGSSSSTRETKWEGVSFLNNFEFTEAGVRVWRAYNVGPGKHLKWDSFANLPDCKPLENIEEPKESGQFTGMVSTKKSAHVPQLSQPEIEQEGRVESNLFFCPDDGCTKSYQRLSALEKHILTGKHVFHETQLTLKDKAKIGYAERLESGPQRVPQLRETSRDEGEGIARQLPMGWALKKTSKRKRFSSAQKQYLLKKFNLGVQTGRKLEASDVMVDLRRAKDDRGVKLFKPAEYLTEQQISSFFSREASRRRKGDEESDDESVQAAVEETMMDTIQNIVYQDLQLIHPITVDTLNICELIRSKTLNRLTIARLKQICNFLNISIMDIQSQGRKRPYINKIEMFVEENCSC